MGRGSGHLAAHMKDFIKNGSKIKILKIPQILMKISEYSILDHMYIYPWKDQGWYQVLNHNLTLLGCLVEEIWSFD